MPSIKEVILESNPWWRGTFNVEFMEREVYREMTPFIKMPQILSFVGLRKVGKTTLMYKIVDDAIKDGVDPRSIMYISFDELRNAEMREIIRNYEEIIKEGIGEKKRILLFDEVQKLEGWEEQLKRVYDINYKKVKIVISGSESLFIRKKSTETLGGRLFEFRVNTLSFREFLRFKGFKFDSVDIFSNELARLFDEFEHMLGFPELVDVNEKEIIRKYIKENIIEKVIYSDIPKIFRIEDPTLLESILNIIMEMPGQIINIVDLANDMQISRHTASKYLYYLEKSFLIRKLYNFSGNRRKMEKKLKKYYPEIISPSLLFKDGALYESKVFEWLVVKLLDAQFFWRNAYKYEVDIVRTEGPTPIEIKYGKIELKGVEAFIKEFGGKEGYIISHNEEREIKRDGRRIKIVPAFKFVLNDPAGGRAPPRRKK